ncbi:MAG: DUF3052 family protein [Flavobacteriaceae bacterium]|nr:DUF3052 family protein [Flavobacteriaceae bacterium]
MEKNIILEELKTHNRKMATVGYSGTPLAKKLGIKEGFTIEVYDSPKKYTDFFYDFPKDVVILNGGNEKESTDFIHIFATTKRDLSEAFQSAKPSLKKTGILWISWPKKSSKIATEIDKFYVMNYGLDNGLVDVKVAAIDDDWSGHKFVYRVKDR